MKDVFEKKKGFTIAELLVVVAIIAVLVAVSIPIFTAQLDKAKAATDAANERALKAVMNNIILNEDYSSLDEKPNPGRDREYYYYTDDGYLVKHGLGKAPENAVKAKYNDPDDEYHKEGANLYLIVSDPKNNGKFIYEIMWM